MTEPSNDPAALATGLSTALKDLHRALIRSEVGDDPALANPYTMLFALIGDPRFSWMAVLSDLITRIDEAVAEDEVGEIGTLAGFRDEASALIGEGGGEAAAAFRLRHLMALHKEPDVGLATGKLRKALTSLTTPPR